jgi:cysteine desulfurase/selenocysteine lyase
MNNATQMPLDVAAIRADFPVLDQTIHRNRSLIYFDNGASTQRPNAVIDAMSDSYRQTYANVHRGIHFLSEQSSEQFENARTAVQRFINAPHNNEIIFAAGTTAAINTVAGSWGVQNIDQGDEILLTIFEHHSNIVPWQQLAQRVGATVRFAGITPDGELDLEDVQSKLNERTKMFAFAAVSNVLGTLVPVAQLTEMAHAVGAKTLVDAAQHTPHEQTDVQAWNADFVVFSGHKMCGPSGIGILWGRQEILEATPPYMGGGGMIDQVTTDGFTWGELPARFEAGTPPIVEAIGLGAAVEYLNKIGLDAIADHERCLIASGYEQLSAIDGLRILGPPADRRSGLISFVVDGVATQDISILLDQQGVAIRAGHHCAMPLHQHLDIRSSCRASFYLYNTLDEVDQFVTALQKVLGRLR